MVLTDTTGKSSSYTVNGASPGSGYSEIRKLDAAITYGQSVFQSVCGSC